MRLRVASYESCRASRCTQATYESTLSPTHLMQQLLAFVHPLLKYLDSQVAACFSHCCWFLGESGWKKAAAGDPGRYLCTEREISICVCVDIDPFIYACRTQQLPKADLSKNPRANFNKSPDLIFLFLGHGLVSQAPLSVVDLGALGTPFWCLGSWPRAGRSLTRLLRASPKRIDLA